MTDLHQQLIAQLERDRTRMLAAADAATVDEVRIAQSGIASGYLHAIALTLRLHEGADAVHAYLRERADGRHLVSHNGPSIHEAKADDARWWGGEKTGE